MPITAIPFQTSGTWLVAWTKVRLLPSRACLRGRVPMNRRAAIKTVLFALMPVPAYAAPSVSTIIGNGMRGDTDQQVNNPYGVFVRDNWLYFCDLDNQRIRRLDLKTRRTMTVAGNGQRGYAGDGGPAT